MNVNLPPILDKLKTEASKLSSLLWGGDRDAHANYLVAQILALEVGASVEPLESYRSFSSDNKGVLDLRESTFQCYAVGTPALNKVTVLGKSRGELWIGSGAKLTNVLINAGDSYFTIVIGPCCDLVDCVIQAGSGTTYLVLGAGVTMPKGKIVVQEDRQYVSAGDDCMFSNDVAIRTSDSHSIFDRETGARINLARPVRIGQHVWLGRHTSVNKGATIGDHVVLGQGSIASGSLEPCSIYAGIPAKLVRSDVTWSRYLAPNYEQASAPAAWKVRDIAVAKAIDDMATLLKTDSSQLTPAQHLSRHLNPRWTETSSTSVRADEVYDQLMLLRKMYISDPSDPKMSDVAVNASNLKSSYTS
jgi:carbonic anhydrase/acetyltransferase-like protein (isoleucine patch superfamily)